MSLLELLGAVFLYGGVGVPCAAVCCLAQEGRHDSGNPKFGPAAFLVCLAFWPPIVVCTLVLGSYWAWEILRRGGAP